MKTYDAVKCVTQVDRQSLASMFANIPAKVGIPTGKPFLKTVAVILASVFVVACSSGIVLPIL